MAKPKETMSTEGYVTSVESKLEKLILGFFLASSTHSRYVTAIKPLPYLIVYHGHSPSELRTNIDINLRAHLSPFFDSIDLSVTYNNIVDSNDYGIAISGSVTEDNKSYPIGYTLITSGKKIVEMIDVINGEPLEIVFPNI